MSDTRSMFRRPLVRLLAVGMLSLFMAAPTPGNVGGCGSSYGSQSAVITAGPAGETAEYMYFDRGLCSNFCWRLRECNLLCMGLANPADGIPPGGTDCDNDGEAAFVACVRGNIREDVFHFNACPHSCRQAGNAVYNPNTYEWDLQVCTDAMSQVACGNIAEAFSQTPLECLHACQVP